MMTDPTQQQAAPSAAPAQDQGASAICIAPQGDGTFAVYKEGSAPDGEPAADLDAALEQARAMLGGQPIAPEGQDEATALIDGFKGARGQVGG